LNTGIGDSCAEVVNLLQVIITTFMTTAAPERCFSTPKSEDFYKENNVTRPSFCFGHVKCGTTTNLEYY
jgi:hypothetical protein